MNDKLNKIGSTFEEVNNKRQRIIKNEFSQLAITYPQFLVLDALSKLQNHKNEVKQIDLAEFTGMDVMTVSTILRNLEKQSLISRTNSKKDTRAKAISLTIDGSQKVQSGQQLIKQIDCKFFSVLDEYTTMFLTFLNQLELENKTENDK